jgi:hypothetical protein
VPAPPGELLIENEPEKSSVIWPAPSIVAFEVLKALKLKKGRWKSSRQGDGICDAGDGDIDVNSGKRGTAQGTAISVVGRREVIRNTGLTEYQDGSRLGTHSRENEAK